MIVKFLEPKFIRKKITLESGDKEVIDIPNGFYTVKMEVDNISTFREAINERTGKTYKTRSFLKIDEGWLLVKHSINELSQMKKQIYNTVEIKGFRK
jgi:hypothetical protein